MDPLLKGRILKEGITENSHSPWRVQVLMVKGKSKTMVIDYSQTTKRNNRITKYKAYDTTDLILAIRYP